MNTDKHESEDQLVFQVVQEDDGGYCAECLTQSIFAEGNTWEELPLNARSGVEAFFFDNQSCASATIVFRYA